MSQNNQSFRQILKQRLDWITTLVPFAVIVILCFLFMDFPEISSQVLGSIRFFLGDQFSSYYLVIGLAFFGCSLYMAFSKYGTIKLGNTEKPQYSAFQWGSMMFTSGLAADILFYSLCEWLLYAMNPIFLKWGSQKIGLQPTLFSTGAHSMELLSCLSSILWIHAPCEKEKPPEIFGGMPPHPWQTCGRMAGRLIDLTAVFALLAGTATTFSLATPLLSMALSRITGLPENRMMTIFILVVICAVYTIAVYFGMQGVSRLAASCVYLFFGLSGLLSPSGRPGALYPGNRPHRPWKPDPELYFHGYLDRMQPGLPPSPKTGRYFTGPTGWYGVWPLLSSSAPSAKEEPSARPCWEAISLVCPEPLPPLSFLEITGFLSRFTISWI